MGLLAMKPRIQLDSFATFPFGPFRQLGKHAFPDPLIAMITVNDKCRYIPYERLLPEAVLHNQGTETDQLAIQFRA